MLQYASTDHLIRQVPYVQGDADAREMGKRKGPTLQVAKPAEMYQAEELVVPLSKKQKKKWRKEILAEEIAQDDENRRNRRRLMQGKPVRYRHSNQQQKLSLSPDHQKPNNRKSNQREHDWQNTLTSFRRAKGHLPKEMQPGAC